MTEHTAKLRADAHRNRAHIIAAARDVFAEQGAQAPLDEIARRAGVGIATLYRRFPDREALIRQVGIDNMTMFLTELDDAFAAEPNAWQALRRLLRGVITTRIGVVIPVLVPDLIQELTDDDELWSLRQRVFGRMEQLTDAARNEGHLRPDVAAGDILLGVIKLCRPIPALDSATNDLLTERHAGMFVDGLRAGTDTTALGADPLTLNGLDTGRP